jgi:hypothetical protein
MLLEGKPRSFLKLVPRAALNLAYREELRATRERVKKSTGGRR